MKSRIAYLLGIITGALAVYLWLKPKLEKLSMMEEDEDWELSLQERLEKAAEYDKENRRMKRLEE